MAEVKQIISASENKMQGAVEHLDEALAHRSEERRVGKEC